MSKPKPGLGKGIVRTLVNHPPVSSSSLQLVPSVGVSSHYIGSSVTSSASGAGSAGRRDFATLGLPRDGLGIVNSTVGTSSCTSAAVGAATTTTTVASTATATATTATATATATTAYAYAYASGSVACASPSSSPWLSLLPSWDEALGGDIVIPYRVTKRHSSTRSGKGTVSSTSKRGLSTLSPHTPSLDAPPSLFPSLALPSHVLWNAILEKSPLYLKNSFSASDSTSLSVDFISSPPSPPPTLRTRQAEVHPALSPVSNPLDTSSAPTSLSSGGFHTLGVPRDKVLDQPPPEADGESIGLYSSNNLIFHLGASGLAKDRPPFSPPARARSPPLPHRPRSFPLPPVTPPAPSELKSVGVGEDAYFTRVDGMCIADGVGGWARSGRGGADAGRWSKLLTHFCEVELDDWWEGRGPYVEIEQGEGWAKSAWEEGKAGKERRSRRPLDPVEIMQRGYEKCLSCFVSEKIHGSSTCLLATLHHSTLSIANLGDCCLLVIRSNEIIFRSEDMTHAFNFPVQLGTHSRDEPMKDAQRYDVKVSRGDVVVLGSDGLMDNLFDEDILETLAQFQDENGESTNDESGQLTYSPQQVSDALCQRARAVSEQTSATTPFMVRAIDEGIDFVGGKMDDITVVVGVVGDREGEDGLALHTH